MKKTAEEFLNENFDWFDKSPGGEKLYFESIVIKAMREYATQCQQDNHERFMEFINYHCIRSSEAYKSNLINSYKAFLTTLNKP